MPGSDPGPDCPQIVPDYELMRCVGRGAYGEVWLSRSKATGVLRAAKIVWRRAFEDDRPFEREFNGIQRFERISREHPGQLALFHIGRNEAEGYFYYVMELADDAGGGGDYCPRTLRADLGNGRIPAARVLEIGRVLAEALGHLHRNGLVHRDVKPSNVIFVKGSPKLADIGLVTDASDQCSIVGTEGYLPPEGPGTPQADIFALGKVLYEAATGMDRREFPKLPEDLRSWPDAKLVFELNEIILKTCASDTRSRYPTVERLLEEVQALQVGKSIKRRRSAQWWWAAARRAGIGLAAIGVLVVGVSLLLRGFTPPGSRSEGPDSKDPDANTLCRTGMDIIRDDIYDKFGEAYTNLLKAIDLDSKFARPYIGLLELRVREHSPAVKPMRSSELRDIARKLDELLPHSAPAWCAHSVIEFFDWHCPQAEDCAKKAIAADPNYELAHTFYAFMLTQWGKERLDEARRELARSDLLRHGKATIPRCLGHIAYAERNYTNAIFWYGKALAIEPHHAPAILSTGKAYQAMGYYPSAISNFEKYRELTAADKTKVAASYESLAQAFAKDEKQGYWDWYWRQTQRQPNSDYYFKAIVQIHRGDTNAALGWLNASYTNHEHAGDYQTPLTQLLFDEHFDGLRDRQEFKDLLEKMTFTKVMHSPNQRGRKKRSGP